MSALLLGGCASAKKSVTPPQPPVVEPTDPIPEELRLTGNEYFPGQTSLTDKVGKDGFNGTLAILDFTIDDPDPDHAERVSETAIGAGVPERHITIQGDTRMQSDGVSNVPEGTRVAVMPVFPAYHKGDGLFLASHGSLIAIAGANNMEDSYNGDRDIYSNPNHPAWTDRCIPSCGTDDYYHTMNTLKNGAGRALLATLVSIRADGTADPVDYVVMCGDAMYWCFAVRELPLNRRGVGGTSHAAPILGAHAFYLSQLWDTAEEVFGVLRECAVDIGEPGVDREFGLGVPSAICGTVQNRERQVASSSLSVWGSSAVIPALLSEGRSSVSFSRNPSMTVSFTPRTPDLFVSFSSLAAGKSFRRGSTSFTALAGAGLSPLGVSSSLTGRGWSYFAETGLKRTFLDGNASSLSFLAAAGAQTGTFTSLAARTGVAFHKASFTVYTGATYARASVAIPGHAAVGVPPASAATLGWEVSLHRSFSLASLGFRRE